MMSWRYKLKGIFRTRSSLFRGGLAEFLGTFILVVLGNGCVAQSVLSQKQYGDFFSITVGYGLAVTMGVTASIGSSGGHVNPAVTLVMALLGRCRWSAVPVFVVAQYLGAFAGAACVFGVYYDALNHFDPNRTYNGSSATAQIFATYPQEFVSTWQALVDQIVGTALLMVAILSITDKYNSAPSMKLTPLLVGLSVTLIGNAFGFNCGFAINPARDFSPRLFTLVAGWGADVLHYRNYNWFWVPIAGPHVGALLGGCIYQLLVGAQWPDDVPLRMPAHEARENPLYVTKVTEDDYGTGFESREEMHSRL